MCGIKTRDQLLGIFAQNIVATRAVMKDKQLSTMHKGLKIRKLHIMAHIDLEDVHQLDNMMLLELVTDII